MPHSAPTWLADALSSPRVATDLSLSCLNVPTLASTQATSSRCRLPLTVCTSSPPWSRTSRLVDISQRSVEASSSAELLHFAMSAFRDAIRSSSSFSLSPLPTRPTSSSSFSFSSPPSFKQHTFTLSSRATADSLVINIPVAEDLALRTSEHLPPSVVSPVQLDSPLSLYFPASVSTVSALTTSARLLPEPHTSISAAALSPSELESPQLVAASSPSASAAVQLTSEQKRQRRRLRHRSIDEQRRGREASALLDLERAMRVADESAGTPSTERSNGASGCVERARRRAKSKAAVLAMAASRIQQLEQSLAVLQQRQSQPADSVSLAHSGFFRATSVQVIVFSPRTRRCVDANDAFCLFTGYSHRQLLHSRLALCPAPHWRVTGGSGSGSAAVEQWEVDEQGRTVPVPLEQMQHNWEQMQLLVKGVQRKVLCTFRVALAGQRLAESQCECWLSGHWPLTAPEQCHSTERFIIVQTSPERYRPVVA